MQQSGNMFGELLGRLVPLTSHDVCDILEEQGATGRRFGEIALAHRFCRPQDLWRAWAMQLGNRTPRVDLAEVGVDARAVARLPASAAVRLGVIPMRDDADGLIVAASDKTLARATEALATRFGGAVRFVLAEASQIRRTQIAYYGEEAVLRVEQESIPAARARPACAARRCAAACRGSACKRLAS